jgi:hypothetical protein
MNIKRTINFKKGISNIINAFIIIVMHLCNLRAYTHDQIRLFLRANFYIHLFILIGRCNLFLMGFKIKLKMLIFTCVGQSPFLF